MLKKTFTGIMLTLLATSMLVLAFKVQQAKPLIAAGKTWYVGPPPSDFASIQEAINNENVLDGDIIEVQWKATPYYENVTVSKTLAIRHYSFDPPGYYPTVDGGNKKGIVFNVIVIGVEISGFIIRNGLYGILLASSSASNRILNNTVNSNIHGIYIVSTNNTLRTNKITGNTWNFGVLHSGPWNVSTPIDRFIQDIDQSNTVDGKPIYYWVNQHDKTIPSNAGYVAIVNSTGVAAKNLYSLRSNRQGVLVAYSTDVVVENIRFVFPSDTCVELVNSTNSIVHNITVTDNFGISLSNSKSNIIKNNKMSSTGICIQLSKSDYNNIADNMIVNSGAGIILTSSINNTIVGNTVSNSHVYGIALQFGSNNSAIFHNNFLYNSPNHTIIWESFDNKFDNVFEGNYWSDYTSNYPDAKERNGTGIWDTPYQIDSLNQDNCPLMDPWSAHREFKRPMKIEKQPLYVHRLYTYSNSTLASFAFSRFESKTIGFFTVSKGQISLKATAGYDGFLNITIPRNWLDGPFTVLIDNKEVDYLMAVNTTHTSIHITYEKGSQAIQIKGVEAGDIFCDVNGDGKIDITDIATVIANYGSLEKT